MNFSLGKRLKYYIRVKIYYFSTKLKGFYSKNSVDNRTRNGFKRMYYSNGNLKTEFYLKNEKVEGIANFYYPNGNIKAREFYVSDKLHGLSLWYYESGELESEKIFKEGALISYKNFDKLGNTIEEKRS